MEKQLVRIDEAATALGLGRTKLYELIAEGALPRVRVGRAVRIHVDDVIHLASELRRTSSEEEQSDVAESTTVGKRRAGSIVERAPTGRQRPPLQPAAREREEKG